MRQIKVKNLDQATIQMDDSLSESTSKKSKIPSTLLNNLKQSQSKKQLSPNIIHKQKSQCRFRPCLSPPQETSICQICETDFLKTSSQLYLSNCPHKQQFCESCLHHYVIYKVKTFQQVSCPRQQCKSIMDVNTTFFKQLPFDIQKRYKKIRQFYSIVDNKNQRLCVQENCDGVMNKTEARKFQCAACDAEICSDCSLRYHQGACDEHQVKFFQQNLHYRKCKECQIIIEKKQGCNHMTCKCGYQFCYVCGDKWNHSHFAHHHETGVHVLPYLDCRCLEQRCGERAACVLKFPLKMLMVILLVVAKIIFFFLRDFWLIVGMMLAVCMAGSTGFAIGRLCKLESMKFVLGIIFFPVIICLGIKQAIEEIFIQTIRMLCEEYSQEFRENMQGITSI